jgi:predicted transcriptional regulator YheO
MNTTKINMHPLLASYLPMLDFLAALMGKDAEIVLHDVSHMDNSVVAIRNGHVSGREVGAPTTNLALKLIKNGKYGDSNFLANYKGLSDEGKTLRSSTYFIRDNRHKLIGMLCINIDTSRFEQFRDFLDGIVGFPEYPVGANHAEKDTVIEHFSNSVEAVAFESIDSVLKERNISPKRMSQDEKIDVIKELNKSGVFLLKGSVSEVAVRLKVSEATIYRYLNKIKKRG